MSFASRLEEALGLDDESLSPDEQERVRRRPTTALHNRPIKSVSRMGDMSQFPDQNLGLDEPAPEQDLFDLSVNDAHSAPRPAPRDDFGGLGFDEPMDDYMARAEELGPSWDDPEGESGEPPVVGQTTAPKSRRLAPKI